MKKLSLILILLVSFNSIGQFIAKVQMNEAVEGICDQDNVYALFNGFDDQVQAKCSKTQEEMQSALNGIQYFKDNPKAKGKGMIGVFINCDGETVQWRISIKTKEELDDQLLEVFKTFTDWTPGTFKGKNVDSSELFSYKIKKGVLTLE